MPRAATGAAGHRACSNLPGRRWNSTFDRLHQNNKRFLDTIVPYNKQSCSAPPRDVNSQESIRGARWRAFELALPAVLFWLEIAPFRRAGSLRHKDRLVAQGLRLLVSKRLQGCSRQRRRPPRKLQRGLTQKRPQYVLGAYLALRVTPIFSLKSGPSGASAIDNILPQEHFWKIHWQ